MIDRTHNLSVVRQCEILQLARSTAYYTPKPTSPEDLALMRRIDELHLEYPFAGSRMLRDQLRNEGQAVGRQRIRRLMRQMGIEALYRKPNTSRRILARRLSNTLTTDFCIEALQEAIARYGTPELFNTDQGRQATSSEFTAQLKANGIRISMDGKGCWRDNVFVERLWRTIKYDEVYLKAHESVSHAKASLGQFITFYNSWWPHQAFAGKTPYMIYFAGLPQENLAA